MFAVCSEREPWLASNPRRLAYTRATTGIGAGRTNDSKRKSTRCRPTGHEHKAALAVATPWRQFRIAPGQCTRRHAA
jgi:hypothetical protein